jgi:hypothetical protein
VLKSLAEAFNMSAESLLGQAGLLDGRAAEGVDTESAIRADPRLTQSQKQALLGVYRDFTASSEN